MIQPTSLSAAIADFSLPKQTTADDATIVAFGQVYAANNKQFATRETADALASFLGGSVSDLSEQWGLGRISPLYQIEFGNGMSLNAGLLADRFVRYGNAAALTMTEAEVGVRLQPPGGGAVASSSSPTSSPALAAAAEVATPAPSAEQKKLIDSARQFESLLMAQILKSAVPEDEEGGLLGTANGPSEGLYQLALENFAAVLGEHGGLGLANSVVDHLKPSGTKTSIVG